MPYICLKDMNNPTFVLYNILINNFGTEYSNMSDILQCLSDNHIREETNTIKNHMCNMEQKGFLSISKNKYLINKCL